MPMRPLDKAFFSQAAPIVARQLIGNILVRTYTDGKKEKYTITATEAYFGVEDKANHASKGRTTRTEIMFQEAGFIYVYLIYGIYWLFNIVTGEKNHPEAVLICGLNEVKGSGKVGKLLGIDKSFYGKNIFTSDSISFFESEKKVPESKIFSCTRIGINYAGIWKDKLWRFELK